MRKSKNLWMLNCSGCDNVAALGAAGLRLAVCLHSFLEARGADDLEEDIKGRVTYLELMFRDKWS
jgi:hypothetical protein